MPNRILRDWTDSEAVNALSVHAERFFVRLIMKADDYGRLTANPKLLRAMLYPLTFDTLTEKDVTGYLDECKAAGLLSTYEADGKLVLEIRRFNQRVRAAVSKWPAEGGHPTVNGRLETETETESYSETKSKAQTQSGAGARWMKFWNEYPKKSGREEAYRVFRDIDPDDSLLDAMIAGLARAKRSADWQREEGRFVPKAASWLSDGRWEEHRHRPARRSNAGPDPTPEERGDVAGAIRKLVGKT